MKLSPMALEILLHYYYSGRDHDKVSDGNISVRDITSQFILEEVFQRAERAHGDMPRSYNLTDKGKFWVEMILATPMPVSAWIDPRESGK